MDYCINDTGTNVDGNYEFVGDYNSKPYWTGNTTPTHYIFFNGNEWCLSDSLGGDCILFGAYPCQSTCPDICEHYLNSGICLTPTPTPTINCDVLDFDALFDCQFTPTPTITPTNTQTPTLTPTPSQTEACGYMDIDCSITAFTPTPTITPTNTPTPSPEVVRPFNFSGDVTFNTIDGDIKCPSSMKFQDCFNGEFYYTTESLTIPISGGVILPFMVFNSNVNNYNRCISYLGIDNNIIGNDTIDLISGPLGYSNLGECVNCVAQNTPTPTNTPTQTVTPTPSITPTSTPVCFCVTFTCALTPGSFTYFDCDTNQVLTIPMAQKTQITKCTKPGTITTSPSVTYTIGPSCNPGEGCVF